MIHKCTALHQKWRHHSGPLETGDTSLSRDDHTGTHSNWNQNHTAKDFCPFFSVPLSNKGYLQWRTVPSVPDIEVHFFFFHQIPEWQMNFDKTVSMVIPCNWNLCVHSLSYLTRSRAPFLQHLKTSSTSETPILTHHKTYS